MEKSHGAPRRPVMLIILDGYGVNPSKLNNAIAAANTPNFDHYFARCPHTVLQSSGCAVGLMDGQMGNSEVGHLTMGCGTVICQDIVQIDNAIVTGEFFKNDALLAVLHKAAANDRPVQLLGLVSDGGVHSHIRHLLALIELCKQKSVKPLVHMITDGRDTPPQCAIQFLKDIEPALQQANGAVVTVMGRYYAMDRDHHWQRTELAWRALVLGEGRKASSAWAAIETAYAAQQTDEFIKPIVLSSAQSIRAGDPIICFNFRQDRPKQIVAALSATNFKQFARGDVPANDVTCMTSYDSSLDLPYAFEHHIPPVTLGEVINNAGLQQFHCAETEKYAHVTYFFNGRRAEPFSGETQLLVPSPKVATYDLQPEMSAAEVADAVISATKSNQYAFILVNFANADMVGHTAIMTAAIKAVEALDKEVGRVLEAAEDAGYSVILTADHGNCEEMVDCASGAPHTQHTNYPVPCLIMDESVWRLSSSGGLVNIAPTVLNLLGLDKPKAMVAKSLLLAAAKKQVSEATLEADRIL